MQNIKFIILTIILCSLLISCSREDEEQEIIAALFRDEICKVEIDTIRNNDGTIKEINSYRMVDTVVIQDLAGDSSNLYFDQIEYNYLKSHSLKSLTFSLCKKIVEQNKKYKKLRKLNIPGVTFIYLTDDEKKKIFTGMREGWEKFRIKYGEHSLCWVSRPAINLLGNMAIITFGNLYDGTSGGGTLYLLRKISGKWVVVEQVGTWVS